MDSLVDRRFEKVTPASEIRYDCSPDMPEPEDFQGIRVSASARVGYRPGKRDIWGAFAKITLCGACRVSEGFLHRHAGTRPLLIAVDARSHEAWAQRFATEGDPPRGRRVARAAAPAEPERDECIWTMYFNANLASALDLPEREADYLAYATLGEHVSNVVFIEVRREGEPGAPR